MDRPEWFKRGRWEAGGHMIYTTGRIFRERKYGVYKYFITAYMVARWKAFWLDWRTSGPSPQGWTTHADCGVVWTVTNLDDNPSFPPPTN